MTGGCEGKKILAKKNRERFFTVRSSQQIFFGRKIFFGQKTTFLLLDTTVKFYQIKIKKMAGSWYFFPLKTKGVFLAKK